MEMNSDNQLQQSLRDLLDRQTELLSIINQIENKGKGNEYFSSADFYKDQLDSVESLIRTLRSVINKST